MHVSQRQACAIGTGSPSPSQEVHAHLSHVLPPPSEPGPTFHKERNSYLKLDSPAHLGSRQLPQEALLCWFLSLLPRQAVHCFLAESKTKSQNLL